MDGTFIIHKALQRIGCHSVAKPAAPETIENCKDALNSMMEWWKSIYIDIGVSPLNAPGDELGEPEDARNAIVDNLAVYISPDFSNGKMIVSPELMASSVRGFNEVKKLYQRIPLPNKIVSETMPVGAGNMRWPKSPVFAGQDYELDA